MIHKIHVYVLLLYFMCVLLKTESFDLFNLPKCHICVPFGNVEEALTKCTYVNNSFTQTCNFDEETCSLIFLKVSNTYGVFRNCIKKSLPACKQYDPYQACIEEKCQTNLCNNKDFIPEVIEEKLGLTTTLMTEGTTDQFSEDDDDELQKLSMPKVTCNECDPRLNEAVTIETCKLQEMSHNRKCAETGKFNCTKLYVRKGDKIGVIRTCRNQSVENHCELYDGYVDACEEEGCVGKLCNGDDVTDEEIENKLGIKRCYNCDPLTSTDITVKTCLVEGNSEESKCYDKSDYDCTRLYVKRRDTFGMMRLCANKNFISYCKIYKDQLELCREDPCTGHLCNGETFEEKDVIKKLGLSECYYCDPTKNRALSMQDCLDDEKSEKAHCSETGKYTCSWLYVKAKEGGQYGMIRKCFNKNEPDICAKYSSKLDICVEASCTGRLCNSGVFTELDVQEKLGTRTCYYCDPTTNKSVTLEDCLDIDNCGQVWFEDVGDRYCTRLFIKKNEEYGMIRIPNQKSFVNNCDKYKDYADQCYDDICSEKLCNDETFNKEEVKDKLGHRCYGCDPTKDKSVSLADCLAISNTDPIQNTLWCFDLGKMHCTQLIVKKDDHYGIIRTCADKYKNDNCDLYKDYFDICKDNPCSGRYCNNGNFTEDELKDKLGISCHGCDPTKSDVTLESCTILENAKPIWCFNTGTYDCTKLYIKNGEKFGIIRTCYDKNATNNCDLYKGFYDKCIDDPCEGKLCNDGHFKLDDVKDKLGHRCLTCDPVKVQPGESLLRSCLKEENCIRTWCFNTGKNKHCTKLFVRNKDEFGMIRMCSDRSYRSCDLYRKPYDRCKPVVCHGINCNNGSFTEDDVKRELNMTSVTCLECNPFRNRATSLSICMREMKVSTRKCYETGNFNCTTLFVQRANKFGIVRTCNNGSVMDNCHLYKDQWDRCHDDACNGDMCNSGNFSELDIQNKLGLSVDCLDCDFTQSKTGVTLASCLTEKRSVTKKCYDTGKQNCTRLFIKKGEDFGLIRTCNAKNVTNNCLLYKKYFEKCHDDPCINAKCNAGDFTVEEVKEKLGFMCYVCDPFMNKGDKFENCLSPEKLEPQWCFNTGRHHCTTIFLKIKDEFRVIRQCDDKDLANNCDRYKGNNDMCVAQNCIENRCNNKEYDEDEIQNEIGIQECYKCDPTTNTDTDNPIESCMKNENSITGHCKSTEDQHCARFFVEKDGEFGMIRSCDLDTDCDKYKEYWDTCKKEPCKGKLCNDGDFLEEAIEAILSTTLSPDILPDTHLKMLSVAEKYFMSAGHYVNFVVFFLIIVSLLSVAILLHYCCGRVVQHHCICRLFCSCD